MCTRVAECTAFHVVQRNFVASEKALTYTLVLSSAASTTLRDEIEDQV